MGPRALDGGEEPDTLRVEDQGDARGGADVDPICGDSRSRALHCRPGTRWGSSRRNPNKRAERGLG